MMRDHPFEGEGIHCKHWSSSNYGNGLTMSSECGYPRDTHPQELEVEG